VICGISILTCIYSIHHRRNRAMGGSRRPETNSPVCLITVCGDGVTGCHGRITENRNRKKAIAAGWIVRNNGNAEATNPALIPVRVWWLGMRWATDDGRWLPVPETVGHWPPGYNPDDDPPAICFDCGIPTCPPGGPWEYYMVTSEVWAAAGRDSHDGGYLCIGCLEARLSRELTPVDFADFPVNQPDWGWKSGRLLTRLGYGEAA
jgi:hypothetical protein